MRPCLSDVELEEDNFGILKDAKTGKSELIRRFTMTNKNGMSVQIITYGATVTSIKVPDKDGKIEDVVLGFDDLNGYRAINGPNPYFGAVVGRVANRIAKGQFKLGDQTYQLAINNGENHLHGGLKGFDKVIWESHVVGTKLTLSYVSRDGEEGYPGEVLTHASYQLTPENELVLELQAMTTKPTPINLANHTYFNLAGHASGSKGLYDHVVRINAEKYTPVTATQIPTGELVPVAGTGFDLRNPKRLGDVISSVDGGGQPGFDHNFCINSSNEGEDRLVARVVHPPTGRVMVVMSDQPGVQFYTSNFLPSDTTTLKGKDGIFYSKHGGFCLETQLYPNSINQPNFPDCVVRPGAVYSHTVKYCFSSLT